MDLDNIIQSAGDNQPLGGKAGNTSQRCGQIIPDFSKVNIMRHSAVVVVFFPAATTQDLPPASFHGRLNKGKICETGKKKDFSRIEPRMSV